jgi:hypothetical protein
MPRKKEHWLQNKWRPAIAWVYIAICVFDFIIGPIVWTMLQQSAVTGLVSQQWVPLTLGAGGLFHAAMGAILGVTSWSRGKEKLSGVAGEYYDDEDQPNNRRHRN